MDAAALEATPGLHSPSQHNTINTFRQLRNAKKYPITVRFSKKKPNVGNGRFSFPQIAIKLSPPHPDPVFKILLSLARHLNVKFRLNFGNRIPSTIGCAFLFIFLAKKPNITKSVWVRNVCYLLFRNSNSLKLSQNRLPQEEGFTIESF